MPRLLLISGVAGFMGVALGAFGAHSLKDLLLERQTTGLWETAVFYHLVHATAILVAAVIPLPSRWLQWGAALWGAGIVSFSGSLYALAVGWGPSSILGPITPLGGLLLLAGWACLIGYARSLKSP